MTDVVMVPVFVPESAVEGMRMIAEERRRQINDKGYTVQHDSNHEQEELIAAGLCYIEKALWDIQGSDGDNPPYNWPWGAELWKPSEGDTLKDLRRGAALIAAAIDWAMNPE